MMKKFEKLSDIPDYPKCKTKEEQYKICEKFLNAGALAKEDLIRGAWYLGNCRNSSIAQWTGKRFQYIREKLGSYYIDTLNHFQDDDGYDVFVPFKIIDIK